MRYRCQHEPEECGFVAFAAVRYGCQVGRIGLEQHALKRHIPYGFMERMGIAIGDDATDTQVQAQFEESLCQRAVPGEAVHHATQRSLVRAEYR